jgi:excisionase family DNA binding protein
LNEDLLLDLYYGELPAARGEDAVPTVAEAHAHLAGCATCRAAWDALRRHLDRLGPTADPVPAPRGRALTAALRTLGLAPAEARPLPSPSAPRPLPTGATVFPTDIPSDLWPTSGRAVTAGQPGAIMTLEEVADELRVTVDQARHLLGELPYLNIGGAIRIRRATFEAFLEKMEEESRRPALAFDLGHPVLRRQGLI